MKIGVVCEGSLQGEDQQVLTLLAQRIVPGAQVEVRPLGNKPNLIANVGLVSRSLLDAGCCRVVIVWDVQPRWGRPDGVQVDIQDITAELTQHSLTNHPCVFLAPIQAELEAWLLADGNALSAVLGTATNSAQVGNTPRVESNANPKKRLQNIFQQHGRTYLPTTHAAKIVRGLGANFGVLGKVPGFKRFGIALTQIC